MAATSLATLPSSTYVGLGSQGDSHRLTNHGTYDSNIGSLTSHPYQYETNNYGANLTDNQQQSLDSNDDHHQSNHVIQQPQNVHKNKHAQRTTNNQQLNGHSNAHTTNNNNNNNGSNATTRTIQPPHKKNLNNQHVEPKNHQQNAHARTRRPHPPASDDNRHHHSNVNGSESQTSYQSRKQQHHQSQPPTQANLNRPDHQVSKARTSSPPIHPRSPSNGRNHHVSATTPKFNRPPQDLRPTKSSMMRAAANKKKEKTLEQKRKDQFFPASQNKATPTKQKSEDTTPQTDAEQSDIEKTKRKNQKPSHSLSKSHRNSPSDGEQTDRGKTKRNKKQSHSQPKEHQSRRRDDYQTEDNNSSADDDEHHKRHQSKSQKRTTFSDSRHDKHSHLPPIHHSRMPPYHDPYSDYPLPPGHPLRGRFPYDDYPPYGPYSDRYDHRHLYEDATDIPPYLPPYHDPYDAFFDYEKRKVKGKQNKEKTDPHTDHEDNNGGMNGHETEHDDGTKSQLSRKSKHKNTHSNHNNAGRRSRRDHEENVRSHWPPGYPPQYYDGPDMLEIWRQERNDYLKKKFKPTIHDVLYSQQWMKSDSYLENQRRRTLRDTQGYYFPYKKYTLKDYKEMQKLNNSNPFAEANEITIDRKERAKKRQEYGSLVERQMVDNYGTRHIPPREMQPRKPWHVSGAETQDPNLASKRERALEYAKVQVKYRPVESIKNHPYPSDPTEQYANNLFPERNDDQDGSNNGHTNKPPQSYDDYD